MDTYGLQRAIAALAIGGATVALGGAATNVVWAQQAPATTPGTTAQAAPPNGAPGADRQAREQQLFAAVAAKLNLTPQQLQQAFDQARQELGFNQRPADGQRPAGETRPGGDVGGRGFGQGLDAAAQAIGIGPDQLRQEMAGKSLADVARAHNVDPTTVANALKAAAGARIDQAVADGRMTAEQAAQIKQEQAARIDRQLNAQAPVAQGFRGGGPRPQGGGPRAQD